MAGVTGETEWVFVYRRPGEQVQLVGDMPLVAGAALLQAARDQLVMAQAFPIMSEPGSTGAQDEQFSPPDPDVIVVGASTPDEQAAAILAYVNEDPVLREAILTAQGVG